MNLRVLKQQLALHAVGLLVWRHGNLALWQALGLAELGLVILPGGLVLLVLAVLAVLHVLRGEE